MAAVLESTIHMCNIKNTLLLEHVIKKWSEEVASYSFAIILYDSFSVISYGLLQ